MDEMYNYEGRHVQVDDLDRVPESAEVLVHSWSSRTAQMQECFEKYRAKFP